jgi:hypothetical protein
MNNKFSRIVLQESLSKFSMNFCVPILFETFGEKQLGLYRGEPYLSATTGTVIMNAEDKANSEMKSFDNLDKEDVEEVKGGTVRSERDGHIMKPEIKDTDDIEL